MRAKPSVLGRVILVIFILLVVLSAAAAGVYLYACRWVEKLDVFFPGYYIENVNVGGMTVEQAAAALKTELTGRTFSVWLDKKEGEPAAVLTAEQARSIAGGDVEWMRSSTNEVILGFYTRIRNEGLKAKVIVDYIREPFVFAPGNVRVTLDYGIRTSMNCTDFLNPDCVTVPIMDSPCILEVKWDNYLPDVIRDAVQLDGRRSAAFSKYAASRMYD